MEKKEIRLEMIQRRLSMSNTEVSKKSAEILEKLENLSEFKEAKVIMAYYPVRNEVDVKRILSLKDKVILLPKCISKRKMIAVKFSSFEEIKKGIFDIPEPLSDEPYNGEIDLILVPGLAFDERLYRLGYGLGFYDEFLRNRKSLKIGLAYDFQIVKEIPFSNEDVKMDIVISERRILR